MRRALDALYAASGALAAVCLAGIAALMLAQAFARELGHTLFEGGLLIRGADDITAWLCAASAFFALGHTFRHGELVRVGLWVEMLGTRARWWLELAALTVTVVFVGYMAWAVCAFVIDSWKFNEVAQGLIKIPIWIPQLSFVCGVLIFLIALIDDLVAVLRHRKPSYQLAEEARRVRSEQGDFSETV
jgi:TRAP-type C4-dicarboxylate transport system permease small subunit